MAIFTVVQLQEETTNQRVFKTALIIHNSYFPWLLSLPSRRRFGVFDKSYLFWVRSTEVWVRY
jgi:hypothetical protein